MKISKSVRWTLLAIASWLTLGVAVIHFGFLEFVSNPWRVTVVMLLFVPPIAVLIEAIGHLLGDALGDALVPKRFSEWPGGYQKLLVAALLVLVAAALVGKIYFLFSR